MTVSSSSLTALTRFAAQVCSRNIVAMYSRALDLSSFEPEFIEAIHITWYTTSHWTQMVHTSHFRLSQFSDVIMASRLPHTVSLCS